MMLMIAAKSPSTGRPDNTQAAIITSFDQNPANGGTPQTDNAPNIPEYAAILLLPASPDMRLMSAVPNVSSADPALKNNNDFAAL
jgi:hypothetical protein